MQLMMKQFGNNEKTFRDRAIKRGHTTTTVVQRGDNWKVTITYLK